MTGKNRNKETVPAEYERNPSLFLFDHTLFCRYIDKCLFIQLLANFHIRTDCETGIDLFYIFCMALSSYTCT